MLITSPLAKSGNAIAYPGNPALWFGATEVGNQIIGDYRGDLYAEDGVTKLFDWAEYITPARTFGAVITKLAFRGRFGQSARIAIELAGIDNPAGTTLEREAAALFRDLKAEQENSTYIQLNRPDLPGKLAQLEAAGILAPGASDSIINNPVGSVELPGDLRVAFGLPVIPSDAELALNGGLGWLSPDDMEG